MDVHDAPSEEFLVVSLNNEGEDEDWDVLNTLWDEEIADNLFRDLNRDLLGSLNDGMIIIISNSEEEEHEDDHANADVVSSSLRVPSAPSTSATDDVGTPDQVQDDSSGSGSKDEVDTS
jgi:hypothetical protein